MDLENFLAGYLTGHSKYESFLFQGGHEIEGYRERSKEVRDFIDSHARRAKADPKNARNFIDVGILYLLSKNYRLAKKSFNKAIRLDRANLGGWKGLADTYFLNGLDRDAQTTYEKILEFDDSYALAWSGRAMVNLNMHKVSQENNYAEVPRAWFDKAIALEPELDTPYEYKVSSFYIARKYDWITADLERGLSISPENYQLLWVKSGLLRRSDPKAALALVDRSICSYPFYARAWCEKAVIVDLLGDEALARKLLRKAIELNPYDIYIKIELEKRGMARIL